MGEIETVVKVAAWPPRQRFLTKDELDWRDRARRYGHRYVPKAVAYWVGLLRDNTADPILRMRASENLADRFGLPRRKETDVDGPGLSSEAVASAMRDLIEDAVRRILSDRTKYAVRAEDVPFVESNGHGVANGSG